MSTTTERERVKFKILWHLYNHGYFGKKHTPIESLKRGLPSHLKGEAERVARDLIREGLLTAKKTAHGMDVSINPRKAEEVRRYLGAGPNIKLLFLNIPLE